MRSIKLNHECIDLGVLGTETMFGALRPTKLIQQ